MTLNEFLSKMEGRFYHYRGEDHKVQKAYLSSEGVAIITTDKDLIRIDDATVENLELQFVPSVKSINGIVSKKEFTSLIKAEQPTLIKTLMEDLDKVKQNKEYIAQAMARRNIVESVIKMARLELDAHRTMGRSGK